MNRRTAAIAALYLAIIRQREQETEAQLTAAYQQIWVAIEPVVVVLAAAMTEAVAAGETITPAWLVRQEAYRTLERQVEQAVVEIAGNLVVQVTASQAEAVVLGEQAARSMITARGLADSRRVPHTALLDMVGRLQDGTPLRRLFDELGPDVSQRLQSALIEGLRSGRGVDPVARQIRDALGGNMSRAMRIARTEVVSSYRNATLAHYRQHPEIIEGWVWLAAIQRNDPPPCPVCLAMHGTVFPLETPFGSHPACRCTAAPWFRTIPNEAGPTGEEWFSEQPEQYQRRVLRPGEYTAYRDGQITLSDLVLYQDDPEWGPQRRRKPLRAILAGA